MNWRKAVGLGVLSTAVSCGMAAVPCLAHSSRTVDLRTRDASCRIDLDGARVVSYVSNGEEQLWMPETRQAAGLWRHGGIPLCWPWFGADGRGGLHGTAWRSAFRLSGMTTGDDESRAILTMSDGMRTLRCRIALADGLRLEAEVVNGGTNAFSYTIGFHPYFRVASRDGCSVEGLDGLAFVDDPSFPHGTNGVWHGDVAATNAIDRIYSTTGEVHTCILSEDCGRARKLVLDGFTDVNVWNPGADPKFDGELPAGAWRSFLCVEPVRFGEGDEVVLSPGEVRRHSFTISPYGVRR